VSELDELLGDLVAIESINPALDPAGSGEAEIAAFVAAWLSERGLDVTVSEAAPGRPNVVARAPAMGGDCCCSPTPTRSAGLSSTGSTTVGCTAAARTT
jgi:acetylornithine deacetylase/succinyl-diaminopimelate desuccinylase-like protein